MFVSQQHSGEKHLAASRHPCWTLRIWGEWRPEIAFFSTLSCFFTQYLCKNSVTLRQSKPTKMPSCIIYWLYLLLYRTMTMKRRNCWQQEVGTLECFPFYFWPCSGYKSPSSLSNFFSPSAVGSDSTNENIFFSLPDKFVSKSLTTKCWFHSSGL